MAKKDFSTVPTVSFNRSKMDLGFNLKTSMNVGTLYPLDWQEVLPGDTFDCNAKVVARVTSSFLKPVMDNVQLELAHFFIPYRLLYDGWEGVFGNPNPSAYSDNQLNEVPMLNEGVNIIPGTVGDYLGLPLGRIRIPVSVLPFRAFALVYDKWYRNQNVIDEMYINRSGEFSSAEQPNSYSWAPNNYAGALPKVRKKLDYFTSCLPSPQKGAPVPVSPYGGAVPLRVINQSDASVITTNILEKQSDTDRIILYNETVGGDVNVYSGSDTARVNKLGLDFSDLNFANVNDLRYAFQLQKMLERDALGGSRYHEYLNAHFGVYSPDSRFQIPEYLGGGIIPINVQQVAQTSQGTVDSPLANVGGYSLTNGYSKFKKSFTEHGIVMTCGCIRQSEHTYSQGIPKKWTRTVREDFYDPLFANLGEQPVYKYELAANFGEDMEPVNGSASKEVFGYNEAWAEYRFNPSRLSGQMRPVNPNFSKSLDIWHYGDEYYMGSLSDFVISKSFIEENDYNFNRTVSVPSTSIDNFIVDMYFDIKAIRVMPVSSIPGLIDHH